MTLYTPRGYHELMNENVKKQAIRRLKIAGGQVRGLERMLEEDKYCIDIIHQSLATKRALSSFENLILENHLSTHAIEQINSGKKKKAVNDILSIYKLYGQK